MHFKTISIVLCLFFNFHQSSFAQDEKHLLRFLQNATSGNWDMLSTTEDLRLVRYYSDSIGKYYGYGWASTQDTIYDTREYYEFVIDNKKAALFIHQLKNDSIVYTDHLNLTVSKKDYLEFENINIDFSDKVNAEIFVGKFIIEKHKKDYYFFHRETILKNHFYQNRIFHYYKTSDKD